MEILEIILAILITFMLVLMFIRPHHEAKLYQQVTGIQVTYWDAFWLDLNLKDHHIISNKYLIRKRDGHARR